MEKKYYVYEHREKDTGRVFYVGKGFGNRKTRKCDRNVYWKRVEAKHGFSAHILYDGLSEAEAHDLERKIIDAYGRENLCNLTDGGEGVSNPSDSARLGQALGQASEEQFEFFHDQYGSFFGTCFDLRRAFNLTKTDGSNIRAMAKTSRYLSVKGWRMTVDKIGTRNPYRPVSLDNKVYMFYNECGNVFIGSRTMAGCATDLLGPQISLLITGGKDKIKGWSLLDSWSDHG